MNSRQLLPADIKLNHSFDQRVAFARFGAQGNAGLLERAQVAVNGAQAYAKTLRQLARRGHPARLQHYQDRSNTVKTVHASGV